MTQTKTQYKKHIAALYEQLENIKIDFEDLRDDLENESADIEPYENKNDLTGAQVERQEWLDSARDQIDCAIDNIISALDDLDYIN